MNLLAAIFLKNETVGKEAKDKLLEGLSDAVLNYNIKELANEFYKETIKPILDEYKESLNVTKEIETCEAEYENCTANLNVAYELFNLPLDLFKQNLDDTGFGTFLEYFSNILYNPSGINSTFPCKKNNFRFSFLQMIRELIHLQKIPY